MLNIQLAATAVIQQVLSNGRNLNQALDEALRGKSAWTSAQRAALQDLSYGTLRFHGQLRAVLDLLLHKPLTDERVRFLLLVALYQLQYGKSAQHAVVDNAVRAAQTLNIRASGLVNAILRNFLRNRASLLERAVQGEEGRFSYPQWWIDELRAQYGERSAAILDEGNRHPPMALRVNRRRGTAADYLALLAQQDISARLIEDDSIGFGALLLDKPVPVDKLPGFFDGLASVQDAGAQYAAHLLDVHDGMRVLDACAAPGGKTAHILENAAVQMVAVDKDEKRLQRVAQNLQRLGLSAQLVAGDAAAPEKWWDGKAFQRILADVPCSASGVVRRHPDIKWLRRRADIAGCAAQQLDILRALWRLLAQDGKLLYATCSVFRQENEQVVAAFLAQQPDARHLPVVLPENENGQLLPDERHDGFFYALLQKI
ncbi:MAG: 16S rRNA (cytosine(967)-C(5))-methyltransferase [Gallionellales bacterium RIFCSPLOWO2_12_FULL_59_22]|nr:MAG: 16S rRNA (cytosine(967)-C(5))-methyltransferase [Gallionellales bacterium RIFCSPLOWO2_02_FULL_59_110]OGT01312.1 MAG: 16S rRNA (cytosine(967)-C(5))-methyltransferase [Gallionellales bacterium RIFCSPLOWO2_02_58_13]OGT12164.1 MAG: 16S rRNA (cytosine(967)-C(5))-methyltransferase [Gallionellales bacterium RIFCSPLOWO2_12_FULL_59_22]